MTYKILPETLTVPEIFFTAGDFYFPCQTQGRTASQRRWQQQRVLGGPEHVWDTETDVLLSRGHRLNTRVDNRARNGGLPVLGITLGRN